MRFNDHRILTSVKLRFLSVPTNLKIALHPQISNPKCSLVLSHRLSPQRTLHLPPHLLPNVCLLIQLSGIRWQPIRIPKLLSFYKFCYRIISTSQSDLYLILYSHSLVSIYLDQMIKENIEKTGRDYQKTEGKLGSLWKVKLLYKKNKNIP